MSKHVRTHHNRFTLDSSLGAAGLVRDARYGLGGLAVAVLISSLAGCASPLSSAPASEVIPQMLDRQAKAWNRGDLDAFMEAYWRSPLLTFSAGGEITRGWTPTFENYKRRYPSRAAMGHLTFSDLEITPLGADAALVLGRWHLQRDEPVGGVFSLTVRRDQNHWVIIHDHTSREEPVS